MGDPRTKLPKKPTHRSSSDPVGFKSNSYNYKNPSHEDIIFFRVDHERDQDQSSQSESGVSSPTLWANTSPSQFHRSRHRTHAATLSPNSRTQAIAKGQQELMEMVRNMPESCYELSLKDLVECQLRSEEEEEEEESVVERDDFSKESFFPSKKRNENRGIVTRSRSVDSGHHGFYLKMFFPLSFGPMMNNKKNNKKKKMNKLSDSGSNNSCSKVSPKPPVADREWWRKRSSVSGDGDGGGSSSVNSGSNSSSSTSTNSSSYRSNSRHAQGGCWFCISPGRSKNAE